MTTLTNWDEPGDDSYLDKKPDLSDMKEYEPNVAMNDLCPVCNKDFRATRTVYCEGCRVFAHMSCSVQIDFGIWCCQHCENEGRTNDWEWRRNE